MLSTLALVAMLPAALGQTLSNETVLGVYMFHRHGDRTAKAWPPANLTDLGMHCSMAQLLCVAPANQR